MKNSCLIFFSIISNFSTVPPSSVTVTVALITRCHISHHRAVIFVTVAVMAPPILNGNYDTILYLFVYELDRLYQSVQIQIPL